MSEPDARHESDILMLIDILNGAPECGLSIEDIAIRAANLSNPWSFRTTNNLLCDIGSRIRHEKIRVKTGKVTRYFLRSLS